MATESGGRCTWVRAEGREATELLYLPVVEAVEEGLEFSDGYALP